MTCPCTKAPNPAETPCLCPFCGDELETYIAYPKRKCKWTGTCKSHCFAIYGETKTDVLSRLNHRTPDPRLEKAVAAFKQISRTYGSVRKYNDSGDAANMFAIAQNALDMLNPAPKGDND